MERIYGRVRYLGRKREFEERKRGDQRIRKGISARYGRCGMTRMRGDDIQTRGVARKIHSKNAI